MPALTPLEFAKLVREMRGAQKQYFKTRSKGALVVATDLERRVDDATEQILQPPLFGQLPETRSGD